MKKRWLAFCAAAMMLLSACGTQPAETAPEGEDAAPAQTEEQSTEAASFESPLRIATLKGPTSMGLSALMQEESENYTFEMFTDGSEIVPLLTKGELDVALIPANLAATLYQKTEGGIEVVNLNTLGVLELIGPAGDSVDSMEYLKGKTVYMTGKGTTPEAAVRYLLEQAGVSEADVTLEFKSEATEVVSVLSENPSAVAVLPQPFATVAVQQNENLALLKSLNDLWPAESELVTGVTVVRRAYAEEHPEELAQFMADAAASVETVNADPAQASTWVEALDIVKAPIAEKAIPRCNLVCITGEEMKEKLSGYLETLHSFDPGLVGGNLPADDFYYV